MQILITAPSLDEKFNVSGISTVVRQIMAYGRSSFTHFTAGRADGSKIGPSWLIGQIALPVEFLIALRKSQPDIVHINTAFTDMSIWRDAVLCFLAKASGRKLVLAIHGGKYLMNDIGGGIIRRVTANMLRNADAVIALSDLERSQLDARWPGLNVRVLPNAIPFDDVPQSNIERKADRPRLIFFGRMHESKGLHELVDACRTLKKKGIDFELKAYGEGPERSWFVSEMAMTLGDNFAYCGIISGNEKWEKLADADVFVLPSRYGEGLPMAMLEAMAVGCIVVVADVASVAAVINDGENGYLVEPGNSAQLTAVLVRVLGEESNWKTMRVAARETVRTRFSIDKYIDDLEAIYKETT